MVNKDEYEISVFRGLASINIQTQIPKFSFFEVC